MRLDHLRAVVEINLVAIVVRRVVAGRDHDARARAQMTDGEREFRRRARTFEDAGITAIFRGSLRSQLGKLFREMPRIVGDHDLGPLARGAFAGRARLARADDVVQIRHQPLRRAADIEKVHGVCPDAGELRPFVCARFASLRPGHDFSNGPSAQSTCAEGQGAIKTVVELRPFSGSRELRNGCGVDRGRRSLE